ncbi:PREDICTED: translation initiation factor eIF-2B subunit alpha-like [Priapulus caudatus]|uniref:Translation initiation factor eIF-2B subunit alpha-like n=1 Tax=Priapulus caudatus TaxID=37621 RepID=A0ABM1DY84_PRICU|nr:PREDICTED: translation initiation factor eIF-2B subunit alpha-like [Priapulus caudatus]
MFLDRMASSRQKIATLAVPFITDGSTILLHSKSGVVLNTLEEAARHNKRFQVYITQSLPDRSGEAMKKRLDEANIPCTLILDSAVGYIMEKVDFVLVGAEGVVESGGIINQIGTYTLAICAAQMNKPLYALVESFKFVRLYPLNQQDVPNDFKYSSSILDSQSELDEAHPQVDYTPPSFITLLFTDLGVLTPSAVSDELIKLYL